MTSGIVLNTKGFFLPQISVLVLSSCDSQNNFILILDEEYPYYT